MILTGPPGMKVIFLAGHTQNKKFRTSGGFYPDYQCFRAKIWACCGIVRALKIIISSWGEKTPCQE